MITKFRNKSKSIILMYGRVQYKYIIYLKKWWSDILNKNSRIE